MISFDNSSPRGRAKFYDSKTWHELRDQVLQRDHYECQWCGATVQMTTLEVDHIKPIEQYPELACDTSNLRVLCKDCHNKRHGRFNYRARGPRKRNRWADDERW